ncbi:calcium-binding protein [Devosia sp. ZB163]|uniref:calcium-binding protein n=1 Tax=Devosia sp. ZB163 TaxID=3025938 RepID=UPI00235DE5B4|nr:calcium-binding protein [Devosia sp. ZB163]MDC9824438.1 calcium-binding protein [Devosia sp. ZB163]
MITVSASTSAAALQAIIDSAPAGETILLGAGQFEFDRTVVIDRDDVTVMGTGSGHTTINLVGSARSGGAFQVGGEIDVPRYSGEFGLSESAAEGSMYLRLDDATGIETGDVLWVELENTDEYLDSIGDTEWREDKPLRTSMVEVASVHGNTVRLTNGLAFDFSTIASIQKIEVAENVRLGGFSVESGLAEQDPGDFSNVSSSFGRSNVISLSGTSHAKLFDIAVDNAPSNGFTVAQSIFLEASNLSVDGAVNKGDGGNGYAFQLKATYDSELVGLEAFDTRHAVLFASWTSEANNRIQLRETNRDINLHGGPDHGNVIEVLSSVRTELEATYLSPTLFINDEGTSYGAPTYPDGNKVTFQTVAGTNKSEVLVASDNGAYFRARAGADILIGGKGCDLLYAEKGDDLVIGSGGNDTIDGGLGTDVLSYAGKGDDYLITRDISGRFVVHKPGDAYDVVGGIEAFRFKDGTVAASTLTDLPTTYFGTDDADRIIVSSSRDVVLSGDGYDRVVSDYSFRLGTDSEALELTGSAATTGTGNERANSFTGNEAANSLYGLGGDDRFFARGGNDYISGGEGDDELYGQAGNDRLFGGDGTDLLNGGSGADTFVFSAGRDTIEDFSLKSGDRLDIGLTRFASASAFLAAFNEAATTGGDTFDSLGIDVDGSGYHVEIRVADAAGESLRLGLNGATLESLLSSSDWIV